MSAQHECSPEEWEARLELAAAYRMGARLGWHDMLGNHFSLRVPGTEDEYLLNPLGQFFEEITASSLVKMEDPSSKTPQPWGRRYSMRRRFSPCSTPPIHSPPKAP